MIRDKFATPDTNIAVYSVLQARETERRPIRVGVIGAGATGRAIVLQLGTPVPGIRLAGISNRTPAHAERALREAGIGTWRQVSTPAHASAAAAAGVPFVTDDPDVILSSDAIDIVVEVTGSVDFAAQT